MLLIVDAASKHLTQFEAFQRRVGPLSVGVGKERLRARQQDSEAARQQTTAEPSLLDKQQSFELKPTHIQKN